MRFSELHKRIIENGYCIGCGACAFLSNGLVCMVLDPYGKYTPVPNSNQIDLEIPEICPFHSGIENENTISERLYKNGCLFNKEIGFYRSLFGGFVCENDFRLNGSSGGMATWIQCELLKRGKVSAVVNVSNTINQQGNKIFNYSISRSENEVKKSSHSRYYPVEMSEILGQIRNSNGVYVIVGVPCFIKAIRLICLNDEEINQKIKYTISLVCGHLKSTRYTDMLGWQFGFSPRSIKSINYRVKNTDKKSNYYSIAIKGKLNNMITEKTALAKDLFGTDWGLGLFKYKACDYCDDVFGECADVTLGDAWLPRYLNDSKGTNIVIVRDSYINDIVKEAKRDKRLILHQLREIDIINSQKAGLSHKKEGLSYRLYLADNQGLVRPKKRVKPKSNGSNKFLRKHQMRTKISEASHTIFKEALAKEFFGYFECKISRLAKEYYKYTIPFWKRLIKSLIIIGKKTIAPKNSN